MSKQDQQKLSEQRAARAAERERLAAQKQADKERRGVKPNEPRPSKTQSGQKHGTSRVSR